MDSAQSTIPEKFFTLKQAAEILSVTVDTLLEWNDSNILKPTITLNGKIGYTQEQINKFLEIQQLSPSSKIDDESSEISKQSQMSLNPNLTGRESSAYASQQPTINQASEQIFDSNKQNIITFQEKPLNDNNFFQKNVEDIYPESKVKKPSKISNKKIHTFGFIASFSVITISLIVILLTQQNKLKSLSNYDMLTSQEKTSSLETVSTTQINDISLLQSSTPTFPEQSKNKNAFDNNLNNTATHLSENLLSAPYLILEKQSATTAAGINNQIAFVPPPGQDNESNIQTNSNMDISSINYSEITNFASKPNIPSTSQDMESTVFDDNGNLKGETTNTELLATTIGTTGIIQRNKPFKQTIGQNILLVFLGLCLLSVIFVFKKQPAYSVEKSNTTLSESLSFANDPQKQRVLEVDQKTNGTVVLYFQGEEYKISKPELNSESDQFIERLLGFAYPDVKEINYDILKDKKIRLNAPLSKLVTRLGFVGLKRDLFFPRTSKNRVLFRRYLTQQDLISMGLTKEQISSELIN